MPVSSNFELDTQRTTMSVQKRLLALNYKCRQGCERIVTRRTDFATPRSMQMQSRRKDSFLSSASSLRFVFCSS